MTLNSQASAFTDPGPRTSNQDTTAADPHRGYIVVADGMGGAAGGAVASGETVTAVREILGQGARLPPTNLRSLTEEVCRAANHRVCARAAAEPALSGMGSTLALVVVAGGRYCAANVGDSRIYLLRDGLLTQLSHDHSLVQERVDAGIITSEEARTQPDRNIITRAIGVVDAAEPYLVDGHAQNGDLFLVTSDGVHGVLTPTDLTAIALSDTVGLRETARQLVQAALDRGTTDNASAAVLRIIGAYPHQKVEGRHWTRLMQWLRRS